MTEQPPIRDAATVIVLRRDGADLSVLMGMRGAKAAFMPSKFVFPGGAVDHDDATTALSGDLTPQCRRRLLIEPRGSNAANP
ncbi:MAG: DNA mismatch repair protein MutT, partial [Paracoccus sp. (in: a-proteobacteria)]|nr:DNA mismatch repair protein MutT [Paracoccus sp. (in: a-proteobacteria)]